MTAYLALLADCEIGTEKNYKCATTSYNMNANRNSLPKPRSNSTNNNNKKNNQIAISYQINEKTYYYSHNKTDRTWYIQELLKGGKFGKKTSSGTLKNPYHILFTFTI